MKSTTVTTIEITPDQLQLIVETTLGKVLKAQNNSSDEVKELIDKIPVQKIITGKDKLLSKQSFYNHVKEGTIKLWKLGGRSYVDVKEFNSIFHQVKITPK